MSVSQLEALDIPYDLSSVVTSESMRTAQLSPRGGAGPLSQPKAWNPDVHTAGGVTQPILSSSVIGTVLVDVGRGAPIRLQIFGGDDPAQAAADFCAAYRKGVRARKKLLAAEKETMLRTSYADVGRGLAGYGADGGGGFGFGDFY